MTRRVCQIIKLKPAAATEYKAIHAAVWPSVLAALERAHIVDYSIHYYPPHDLLIATFKYVGEDCEGDMKKIAEDPETQRWWNLTDGMQESLVEGAVGSGREVPWWKVSICRATLPWCGAHGFCLAQELEEVFRFEGTV